MMRGAVIWVDFSDAFPPEMGKKRPAVVVSNTVQNQILDSVVAIPLSSRPPEIPPLRVRVQPPGLKGQSFAVIPGIRQLKKSRVLEAAGNLKSADLALLDKAVKDYLSD